MNYGLTLLAQAQPEGQPSWAGYVPFILMGVVMFLFLRMMSKQKREQQNLLSRLKKNDKVVTSGGILGVVMAIKEGEDEVTLRVDDTSGTRIRVLKSSIIKVTPAEEESSQTGKGENKS